MLYLGISMGQEVIGDDGRIRYPRKMLGIIGHLDGAQQGFRRFTRIICAIAPDEPVFNNGNTVPFCCDGVTKKFSYRSGANHDERSEERRVGKGCSTRG